MPWTRAEHDAILERVNRSRASGNDKDRLGVLPIRVGEGEVKGISFNTIPDVRTSPLEETVELITNRLHRLAPERRDARASPIHPPPWPNEPMPFESGLADRVEQLYVIQLLMTAKAAKRILIFKGPGGYGKTALLNAAARYAKILGVPAAYVDFKDSQLLSQTNVLQRLRLDLGAVLPGFTEPAPWNLLAALRHLSSPALILLDEYEKITETKELVLWIEDQLFAEVEKCPQLRFLIGGQQVPNRPSFRWRDLAEEIELNRIDDKQVWTEWIQQKNPHVHVDDKHVKGIVDGLEGVPGNISTVLTTFAEMLPRTP
jgi:hypothetical protein